MNNELPNISNPFPLSYLSGQFKNYFYLYPVTMAECTKLTKNLKETKCDSNTIPVQIFKKVYRNVFYPLIKLLNLSFTAGIFLEIFKVARITQIFKGGDHKNPSNFRPISSLQFISRIFQRCLYNRMLSFSNKFY